MSFLGSCLVKGIGLAGLGLIGYDSHVVGKLQSEVYAKSRDADACADSFNNTMFLDTPSVVKSNMKKAFFNLEVDNNIRTTINSTLGYFKGFGQMLVNNVIPLTLGLTAVLVGRGNAAGKFISKLGAIGLAAYGGLIAYKDGLGFGNKNDLNPPSY